MYLFSSFIYVKYIPSFPTLPTKFPTNGFPALPSSVQLVIFIIKYKAMNQVRVTRVNNFNNSVPAPSSMESASQLATYDNGRHIILSQQPIGKEESLRHQIEVAAVS